LNSQETMSVLKEIESKGSGLPATAQGRYGGVYNILANAQTPMILVALWS
jgi:hypothetical protein